LKNFELIQKIVADATEVDISEINLDTSAQDLISWDSLAQLSIMSALVEKFEYLENNPSLQNANSVKRLLDLIPNE
jgi:acyl carrier protein